VLLVGLFGAQGFKKGDVLYSLDGRAVSDYGEVWCGSSGVSRNVFDVLSSVDWGGSVVVSVLRVGGECVDVDFRYSELRGSALGELRLLDSVLDASVLVKEVLGIKGVTMKPLRLNDVVNYRMANYMGDEHAHKFRIMVANIDSHTVAYHAKSIRPGDILHMVNNKPVPDNWNDFAQMMKQLDTELPLHLTTESNKIIII